jgi:uncharacterized membrane protein YjgN (DUF898 family)
MADNLSKDKTTKYEPFVFNGAGGEYLKIWIVNLILSILTLGIYSAWAKVRTTSYIYSNMSYQNNEFEYLATGLMILKSRIIILLFFVLYVVLANFYPIESLALTIVMFALFPWAYYKSLRFNARMMRYRNVRFNFKGTASGAYAVFMGWGLLLVLTGGLLFPLFLQKQYAYTINNFYYGDKKFNNTTSIATLYKIYFKFVGFVLLLSLFFIIAMVLIGTLNLSSNSVATFAVIAVPLFYLALLLSVPYFAAAIPNAIFPCTTIDDKHKFNSNYKMSGFLKLYLGYGVLIGITLGIAYPWFKMAMLRYRASCTQLALASDLSEITDNIKQKDSAIGDEFGDAFFE